MGPVLNKKNILCHGKFSAVQYWKSIEQKLSHLSFWIVLDELSEKLMNDVMPSGSGGREGEASQKVTFAQVFMTNRIGGSTKKLLMIT